MYKSPQVLPKEKFWGIALKLFFVTNPAIFGVFLAANTTLAGENPASKTQTPLAQDSQLIEQVNQYVHEENNPNRHEYEALDQIDRYMEEDNFIDQVTSVSELRDIEPFWFDAVQKMVDKYGCIVGYPDSTFKGQRNITRYEFAAAVSRCMEYVENLYGEGGSLEDGDLATLNRLMEEFEAELTELGEKVDDLETRLAFVEDHQFSVTTKLKGEAIFALTDMFIEESFTERLPMDMGMLRVDNRAQNTIFASRVRLTLETSFTGRDTLEIMGAFSNSDRFFTPNSRQAVMPRRMPGIPPGSVFPVNLPTGEAVQTFNASQGRISYRFPLGPVEVYISPFGATHGHYTPTFNPYFDDGDDRGNGALSTFAQENPIYRIGGGSGIAFNLPLVSSDSGPAPISLTASYFAGNADDPSPGNGLFNGDYATLTQLSFNLSDRLGLGLTYVHGYHNNATPIFDNGTTNRAFVGTFFANSASPPPNIAMPTAPAPVVTNSYGGELAYQLTDNISFSGFFSYTDAKLIESGDSEIWTYGGGLAFSDLGGEGNVLGVFGGAQPYTGIINSANITVRNQNIPWHLEGFYKYQINENISITPGVIWLLNPNDFDPDAVIGTIRTTFTF